jgi:hypothetical protein
MEWTLGENNHPDMNMVLLSKNAAVGEDDIYLVWQESLQNPSEAG